MLQEVATWRVATDRNRATKMFSRDTVIRQNGRTFEYIQNSECLFTTLAHTPQAARVE